MKVFTEQELKGILYPEHNTDGLPRYIVVEGSDTGHCCFEASVLDTAKCKSINAYRGFGRVCESFDIYDAIMIAESLNKL